MKKIKKKQLFVTALVVVALFVLALLFSFFLKGKTEEEYGVLEDDYFYENLENYSFSEKENFLLVENSVLGFSFEVPKSWKVEESEIVFFSEENPEKALLFLSPNYKEGEELGYFSPKSGCLISLCVYENKNYYNSLLGSIEDVIKGYVKNNSYSVVSMDNVNGKRRETISGYYSVKGGAVVPFNKKIYEIGFFSTEDDRSFCEESFDNLLKTISFEKKDEK